MNTVNTPFFKTLFSGIKGKLRKVMALKILHIFEKYAGFYALTNFAG